MNFPKIDDLDCLYVCRACLAIMPTKQFENNDSAKDDLFRVASVKVSDIIPIGLCQQCKDVVSLFKSFRIQVIKANAVFTDLADKFQSGKKITSKNIIEERRKYILPRIVLRVKDDKNLTEALEEQANPNHGILAATKTVEAKTSEVKNLGVTFASNLISDADAVVKSAHDLKRLRCTDGNCNKIFPTIAMLKKHTSTEHMRITGDITGTFYCPVVECKHSLATKSSRAFANRGLLKQHYVKVHLKKTFTCTKCEMKFPTVAMCSRHEKSCSQNIVCTVCNLKFLKQESLVSHTMRKHPQKYEEELRQKKVSRGTSKTMMSEWTHDSKGVGSQCAVSSDPAANKVPISMSQTEKLLPKPDPLTSSNAENDLIESVLGCPVRTPSTYAVFSDQFTQTSIKTVPKQKLQTNRTSAQTQTFECSTYNKSTGFFTNVDVRTGTSYVDESTGPGQQDHVMVLDPQLSVNQMKPRRRSISDNPSPLLSFSSFDSRSQSVAFNQPTQSNSATIETQTALDELQYSNMHQDIDSNLFSELVSLSDIQTQTVWNETGELMYERPSGDDFGSMDLLNCFDKRSLSSEMECEKPLGNRSISPIPPSPTPMDLLSNLTSSPDLTFKGTQTYFFFNDSPKQVSLMNNKWM